MYNTLNKFEVSVKEDELLQVDGLNAAYDDFVSFIHDTGECFCC